MSSSGSEEAGHRGGCVVVNCWDPSQTVESGCGAPTGRCINRSEGSGRADGGPPARRDTGPPRDTDVEGQGRTQKHNEQHTSEQHACTALETLSSHMVHDEKNRANDDVSCQHV